MKIFNIFEVNLYCPMRYLLLFLSLFLFEFGYSQNDLFRKNDFIQISVSNDGDFVYHHKLKAKQTIYSLSRFFNQPVQDIYEYNGKESNYIFQIDEIVKVPFDPAIMTTNPAGLTDFDQNIAILYQVKPQENLYRISREYFPQSMDHLMQNNKMQSYNLSVNQKLIIGYIPLGGKSTETIDRKKDKVIAIHEQRKKLIEIDRISRFPIYVRDISRPELASDIKMDTSFYNIVKDEPKYEIVEKSGIAMWDKKISDKRNLFVLHKKIKAGTSIEIYYPLLKRSVKAQVVGNIPKGLYSKDVDLIISPRVAKSLGVIDTKFRVSIKYSKEVNI